MRIIRAKTMMEIYVVAAITYETKRLCWLQKHLYEQAGPCKNYFAKGAPAVAEVAKRPLFRLFSPAKPPFLLILSKTAFSPYSPLILCKSAFFFARKIVPCTCNTTFPDPLVLQGRERRLGESWKIKKEEPATFLENIHGYNLHNHTTCRWVVAYDIMIHLIC